MLNSFFQIFNEDIESNFGGNQLEGARMAIPSFSSARHTISRSMRILIPKQPIHRKDLDISGIWSETEIGSSFLLIDDEPGLGMQSLSSVSVLINL